MHTLGRIVLVSACLAAAQVQAQGDPPGQTPQDQPRPQQRPTGVETITVTAEKVETNLQDTALSIQALGARDLENLNIANTSEVGTFVPGVNFLPANNTNAQLSLFLRGTGSADNDTVVNSPTGLYVDGVYIGTGNGAQFDLLDIDRIEVLKGPQGTLYGRNTIGGAVNVISSKPGPEWGGRGRLQVGQHGERIYRGSLNVPLLGERLFSRIALMDRERDYFFEPKAGDGHDDADEAAGRIALRWLPVERTTVDWALDRIKIDNHNPAFQLRALSGGALGLSLPAGFANNIRTDNGAIATDADQFTKFDTWQNGLTLTWDAGENLEVKSISGWRKYRMSGQNDLDGSPSSVFRSGQHAKHRTFYQELQTTGSSAGGFWDYVGGATWFEEETDSDNFSDIFRDTLFAGGLSNTGRVQQDAYAWGIYTQHTLHPTDMLELTGGVRYSAERKEMFRSLCSSNPTLNTPDATCPTLAGPTSFADDVRDARFDNWSPMARASLHWTDELMTWLSWTRGYRSGGFGNRPMDETEASLAPFDEETVSQWETGVKSTWLDSRLQFNASAYYSEYNDQQIAIFVPGGGTATIIQNAGRSRIRGWEMDMRAVPVNGLEIVLTHAYTNSDFAEFLASPGGGAPVEDLADERKFPTIPKRTYSGLVTYTFSPASCGTFEIAGNFRRMGRVSFHADQSADLVEAAHYTIYGVRASLIDAFGMEGVTLSLIGSNVTDADYQDNGINFGALGWGGNTYGDPRHLAFEVTYDWGNERY